MSAKRKTSYLWKYFSQSDPTEAKCNLCSRVLSVTNSCIGNLARHLRLKHRDLVVSREPTRVDSSFEADDAEKQSEHSHGYSYVWRYFDKLGGMRARCVLCSATLSVHTVSNLARHLARKHSDLDISKDPTTTKAEDDTEKAELWRYIEVVDEERFEARCAVCLEGLSYRDGSDELRKHLADAHPNLAAESKKPMLVLASPSGPTSCEKLSFDQIYLEENTPEHFVKRASSERSRHRRRKKRAKTPQSTDSEDDRPVRPKREPSGAKDTTRQSVDDASIDNFGRYIASLIKKLPRHVACKIQVDFVTQIMQAQLEHERSQAELVVELVSEDPGLTNGVQGCDETKGS